MKVVHSLITSFESSSGDHIASHQRRVGVRAVHADRQEAVQPGGADGPHVHGARGPRGRVAHLQLDHDGRAERPPEGDEHGLRADPAVWLQRRRGAGVVRAGAGRRRREAAFQQEAGGHDGPRGQKVDRGGLSEDGGCPECMSPKNRIYITFQLEHVCYRITKLSWH